MTSDPDSLSRLVLGTAQLGMDYGIANKTGRPDMETALSIVKACLDRGVTTFDTAQAYGESEMVLGTCLRELSACGQVEVVTKIDPQLDHTDANAVIQSVEASLGRLGVPRLAAVLVHDEKYLNVWAKGLGQIMRTLKEKGLASKVGFSIDTPQMALQALEQSDVDALQFPTNAIDRRFEKAGVFKLAKEKGKEIYLRSIYLQGLLLLNPETIPARLNEAKDHIVEFHDVAIQHGLQPQEMALHYIKQKFHTCKIVLGSETARQIISNINIFLQDIEIDLPNMLESRFHSVEKKVVSPSLWDN